MTSRTRLIRALRRPGRLISCALLLSACRGEDRTPGAEGGGGSALPPTPAELVGGEALYVANCAACHGSGADGTAKGPPLAHRIYEPSHHADPAFVLAARNGVTAHHWSFGNMPPQPQVTDSQVGAITAYVRWVQRQRGIR